MALAFAQIVMRLTAALLVTIVPMIHALCYCATFEMLPKGRLGLAVHAIRPGALAAFSVPSVNFAPTLTATIVQK